MYYFFWISAFFILSSFSSPPKPDLTLMVPMRDGTLLPTDFYFPSDTPWRCPCALLRSPAGKSNLFALEYLTLVSKGYVVVIQDTRSALDKEGKTFPFWFDGWGEEKDGYDTIEWIAQSPFTNGKVGTVGISALGITQYMMAPSAPPSLVCQHIGIAAPSVYHYAITNGGQVRKELIESWLAWYASDSGVHSQAINQPYYNDFWERFNALEVAHQVKVPAVHYGGWYDIFLQGTIDAFTTLQENGGEGAKGQQKLLIGPWTHLWPKDPRFGDFQLPVAGATPPVDLSHHSWLDFHLKGIDNGIENLPAVTYYVMGPFDGTDTAGNFWRHSDVWPIPATKKSLYLTSNRTLDEKISENDTSLTFIYNPQNHIPTIGGKNLFMESGPKDQRSIESREDLLVFTSEPLLEELEVTGTIEANLFFTTDQIDTDVIVKITDVYPDGKSILITEGIHRIATNPISKELNLKLAPTSLVFAKGHRIRLIVSSSDYPRYERNLNVGVTGSNTGTYFIGNNTIGLGENQPSQIILPVTKF